MDKTRNKEIVEEDNDIRRRVIASLKRQVGAFDESEKVKPMKQISFLESSRFRNLLGKLTKELNNTFSKSSLSVGRESSSENFDAFNELLTFNNIVNIYKNPATDIKFRMELSKEMQPLLSIINNILENFTARITSIIDYLNTGLSTEKNSLYEKLLLESLTHASLYDLMYDYIDNNRYDYINYFNLQNNIKNNVGSFGENNRKIINNVYTKYSNKFKKSLYEPVLKPKEIKELKDNNIVIDNIKKEKEEEAKLILENTKQIEPEHLEEEPQLEEEQRSAVASNFVRVTPHLEEEPQLEEEPISIDKIDNEIKKINKKIAVNEMKINSFSEIIEKLNKDYQYVLTALNSTNKGNIAFKDVTPENRKQYISKLKELYRIIWDDYNFEIKSTSGISLNNIENFKNEVNELKYLIETKQTNLSIKIQTLKDKNLELETQIENLNLEKQKKERGLTPEEREQLKLAFEGKLSKKKIKERKKEPQPILEPQPEEEPKTVEGKGSVTQTKFEATAPRCRNRFNMRFGGLQSLYDDNY